jgi:hypothetical protein
MNPNYTDIFGRLDYNDRRIRAVAHTVNNPSYKVYTATITQSGGNNEDELIGGTLYAGVSYSVNPEGNDSTVTDYDFSNLGGPKYPQVFPFVANKTAVPISWGVQSNPGPTTDQYIIKFNFGAPTVNVLENTIGNIWFTYNATGEYRMYSNGLFTASKTIGFAGGQAPIVRTSTEPVFNINYATTDIMVILTPSGNDDKLNGAPIEIRVYN